MLWVIPLCLAWWQFALITLLVVGTLVNVYTHHKKLYLVECRQQHEYDYVVRLKDGRNLHVQDSRPLCDAGEREVGYDYTLFFIDGLVGTREHHFRHLRRVCAQAGIYLRVITLDRPGVGESTVHHNRTYSTFAHDIAEVAEQLKLSQYMVAGFSSGGPYALAHAYHYPHQVQAVALMAADCEWRTAPRHAFNRVHRVCYTLTETLPVWLIVRLFSLFMHGAFFLLTLASRHHIHRAHTVKQDEHIPFVLKMASSLKHTSYGSAQEFVLERRPWGFQLEDIDTPVVVAHCKDDPLVSIHAAEYNARRLPNVKRFFFKGVGHSVPDKRWVEILKVMINMSK